VATDLQRRVGEALGDGGRDALQGRSGVGPDVGLVEVEQHVGRQCVEGQAVTLADLDLLGADLLELDGLELGRLELDGLELGRLERDRLGLVRLEGLGLEGGAAAGGGRRGGRVGRLVPATAAAGGQGGDERDGHEHDAAMEGQGCAHLRSPVRGGLARALSRQDPG
jgi:hypothetical protein